jgi:hypothetical protein
VKDEESLEWKATTSDQGVQLTITNTCYIIEYQDTFYKDKNDLLQKVDLLHEFLTKYNIKLLNKV